MKLEQIIFAGDSAGGHLTVSVTNLCLLRGFRPPDGIMAIYPCMHTDMRLSPSACLMIDDWLLSENFF
jgi:acetyl esterase/lipase